MQAGEREHAEDRACPGHNADPRPSQQSLLCAGSEDSDARTVAERCTAHVDDDDGTAQAERCLQSIVHIGGVRNVDLGGQGDDPPSRSVDRVSGDCADGTLGRVGMIGVIGHGQHPQSERDSAGPRL
jgi:hypothetical protein